MSTPRSEVATRGPVKVSLMQPLDDLDQALRLSDALSRSELVPRALHGKPANILHVLLTGQSLGLHWSEALRVIYSPGPGQVGMRGQYLLARLRKAGHRYSFEEGEDSCTFKLHRGDTDEDFESTFTIEDAIQAGLARRNANGDLIALSRDNKPLPWQQYTRKMLRWRAVSDCVAFAAPEVLLGFEVEGDQPPEPPQQVQLQPQSPAPPGPAGQAATSDGQAEQADRLRELNERTRHVLAREAEEAEAARPPADLYVGGIPEAEPAPEGGSGGGEQDFPADAGPAATTGGEEDTAPPPAGEEIARPEGGDSGEIARPEPAPADGPADRAKQAELATAFAALHWPPGKFKADVLHACSVFSQRKITAAKDLRVSEAYRLVAELKRLADREDELAPETRLADQVTVWEQAWRAADPKAYAEYEEGK